MSGESFTQQSALCFGNGKALLIGNDSVPKRADITDLLFRRQVIEAGRNWNSVCHGRKIALARAFDKSRL